MQSDLKDDFDWRSKIYGEKPMLYDENELKRQFDEISKVIFKRDHRVCQSCFVGIIKLNKMNCFLTCHHIIPRDEGGSLIKHNLITLCNKCHDIVEERKLKSKAEIYGFMTRDKKEYVVESKYGVRWQQWVYGGKRRPRNE